MSGFTSTFFYYAIGCFSLTAQGFCYMVTLDGSEALQNSSLITHFKMFHYLLKIK